MKTLALNKRARFDYELLETFEAGLVLSGQEVKSIKTGHISLKGSFVTIHGSSLILTNAFIPPYPHAGILTGYDPSQPRTLLVKRTELKRLIGSVQANGLTLVPLRVYTKRHLIKVEFALAKGKKEHDKRDSIQKREAKRRIERAMRE